MRDVYKLHLHISVLADDFQILCPKAILREEVGLNIQGYDEIGYNC